MIKFIIDSTVIECPICYENKKNIFNGKCNHSWCMDCHNKMDKFHTCPLCRTPFRDPIDNLKTPPISPIALESIRRSVYRNIELERRNRISRITRRNRRNAINSFRDMLNERIENSEVRRERIVENNNRTNCSCIIC